MKGKSPALLLLSWIHDILLFEGIYVLAAAVQNIRGQELKIFLFKGLFMLFPVVLSYIVICRCRSLWIFLGFSMAVIWGMKTVSGSLLTGGLTAFVLLFRCYVKLRQGEIKRKMKELPNEAEAQEDEELWEVPALLDVPRVSHCLLFVLMYLGALYFHQYMFLYLIMGILAADLCVCLAYRYLERLEGFIKKNIHVANLPAGSMKKIGTGILLAGLAGLIIFMLPAAVYHEEPLSKLRFERGYTGGENTGYYEENTGNDYMMEELARLKSQAKETPEWMKTASEIISVLTLAGIICLALKMIFMAVRKGMESFSDDLGDEIIFLSKEDEDGEGKKSLFKMKEKERFLSPDRKIRRLYKRLITHTLKDRPNGNETPFELENRAGLYEKEKEKMKRIHEIYEKARYGKEECTKEEVKISTNYIGRI